MTAEDISIPDPRSHPDNANLPNINQPATILGTTIAFLILAVIAISLRLWVRIRDRLWGWDDAFVFLAAIASLVGDSMVCKMPADGLGLHLWTLDHQHLMSYFAHIYTTNSAYTASATLIKLSILFQYLRLFAESAPATTTAQYRLARRLTWCLVVVCSIWGLIFFCLALFSCDPVAKNWDVRLQGKCIGWGSKEPNEFFTMFLGHAVSNLVLDLLVLALPVPFLRMLRLAGKSKAGLIALFGLGCTVGVVAIGRMIALSLNRAGTVPVLDMSYHTPAIYIFGVLEVNIAIITASIPIFWPVIATLAGNKIFVVNEIEIHVEQVTRNDSFDTRSAISLTDRKEAEGKTSRIGQVTTTFDRAVPKSKDRNSKSSHRHKISNVSSLGRAMGSDCGPRPSQDSQHHLYRIPSSENRSSRSLTRSESSDWFMEVDKSLSGGKRTTIVERTDVPFEHIKASDNK